MGKTGKRMYCPNCKKNRTWMSAFKKQQMEPGEKPYDFRFFVCQTCEYAYDPKTGLEIPDWRARYYSAENFEAVVIDRRKPKGIIDKILMNQDMMMRAQMQELDLKLDTDVRLGIISEDQAEDIMMSALMKMGLMPADFDAEEWRDGVKWNDPPTSTPPGSDWRSNVDWSSPKETKFQSAKALDFLKSLAEGSETTELESRFVLSPRHFSQLQARLGSSKFISDKGFGEGPYPVSQSILSLDEIIAQTEMQLHTIFEAFETVLDGAPSEHDDDDHDHDDDDHDHDEFETILELYSPYQPETYRVYVRTSEGVKMMGEFTDVVLAQELADDWNAPGYDDPVAKIEKRLHRNGAFRGLSRVVFEDDSYLTFILMGDLIHRDAEFVDMTSLFIFPRAFSRDANWWETQRNN